MMPFRFFFGALILALAVPFCAAADSAQRPLTDQDAETWRMIYTPILSRDGQWLAYSYMPQERDGDIVLLNISSRQEIRESAGAKPPAPTAPSEESPDPERPPVARNLKLAFTSDNRFLVATVFPSHAAQVKARLAKKKPEDSPKDGLVIIELATGKTVRVATVKNVQVPTRGGSWVAYLKDVTVKKPAPTEKPATEKAAVEKPADSADEEADAKKNEPGTDLTVRNLATGEERVIPDVLDFTFARDGKTLVYAVSAKDNSSNGVYAITPGNPAAPIALLTGKGHYQKIMWDRAQAQLAFLSDRDEAARKAAQFKVYYWKRGDSTAREVVSTHTPGVPAGQAVSENSLLLFSRDGKKLYVPTAAAPKVAAKKPPIDPADKVSADIWRWDDGLVQPMQQVQAGWERHRTFRGVLDLASGKYVQLGSVEFPDVTFDDNGRHALIGTRRPYERLIDYDGTYADFYLADPETGVRSQVLKKLRIGNGGGSPGLSPDGLWAVYYQDAQWSLLNTRDGSIRPLTEKLGLSFGNELNDMSEPPPAYGAAGWTKDSASVLIYDRFDVWQFFMDGRPAKNVMAGFGRQHQIQFRNQPIARVDENDEEPSGLDPAKPLTLRGESEVTRATGFYRTTLDATGEPAKLIWADENLRYVGRAQDANKLIIVASRFDEYPDIHLTDENFSAPAKLTDGGAQMKPFIWGHGELISYQSVQGVPLQGALFTPANFDPKKKYPMIVYFYERLSQELNTFYHPAPSHRVNLATYVSNGYVVFTPDITYRLGHPGQSALDCILPGVAAVVKRGFVDEHRMGLQGHSWGGYQIAYMITQTDVFRAAEAGAPVGNMTSAYSGIRWGSGMPRQFQYEKTQSRINATLQDAPELYIENSPVFHVKAVHTPVLILQNDHDDAVPWYQGIELFLALRRYDKPAWFISYNNEYHGLRRRADMRDFTKRMREFFDHFLKDAPAPEWMTKGVPYLDRDEEKIHYNAAAVDGLEDAED